MLNSIQKHNTNTFFKGLLILGKQGDNNAPAINTKSISAVTTAKMEDNQTYTQIVYGQFLSFNPNEEAQGKKSYYTCKYYNIPMQQVVEAYLEAEKTGKSYLLK